MKKIFFFSCCLIFFLACRPKKEEPVSEKILDKSVMMRILTDIHLAEAAIQQKNILPDSAKKLTIDYYHQVFSKYHVKPQQFDTSFYFYMRRPEMLDEMYQDIINELAKKENELGIP